MGLPADTESNTFLYKCFIDDIEGLDINSNSWQQMKQGRAQFHQGVQGSSEHAFT